MYFIREAVRSLLAMTIVYNNCAFISQFALLSLKLCYLFFYITVGGKHLSFVLILKCQFQVRHKFIYLTV